MPDFYQIPALALTVLLLPAFGHLYLRFRDTRTLLWFWGYVFAAAATLLFYLQQPWNTAEIHSAWFAAAAQISMQISFALFLGSLSPLRFRVGRWNILYVVPFILPLTVYSGLLFGVYGGATPTGPAFWLFPALGGTALLVGLFWGAARGSMPVWLGVTVALIMGLPAIWLCFQHGASAALIFVESSLLLIAALLILFVFRRISPGVVLSVLGFVAWALAILNLTRRFAFDPTLHLYLMRIIVMGKVVAALGMILITLEDELNLNQAAQERERRARRELEAYTGLVLTRRKVEDFDHQANEVCLVITEASRFSQAALLLLRMGRYQLVGSSGFDEATAKALDALARRIPPAEFLAPETAIHAVEHSQTVRLDLTPWLLPGDDLKRLRMTEVLAVPLAGRGGLEGALLLSGMRPTQGADKETLRADDLLPLEMLTARLQATRSQTTMMEKLVESEKFSGLGQLAANVVQQMNNPLTVILGYASLLEDAQGLNLHERKGVDSILTEARRMKSILESLSRLARSRGDQPAIMSVEEMLNDLEQLYRTEFLNRAIEFRLNVAPGLPRVICSPQQLRQAVIHCLRFAIEAVDSQSASTGADKPKTIRLDVSGTGSTVQILVAHSGQAFLDPERAFDPFTPAQAGGTEAAGLGLSLCATILREHNGRATALNLEPRGAAIMLELRAA